MNNSDLHGLAVYASGTYPVELSVGRRVMDKHRVPVLASVDDTTGEVRLYIDPVGIEILKRDNNRG